ncbi:helix-turn-helix transcriptional regulator [Mesorhizobium sp. B2-3-4]|uniref:helix-turn-helix transcriptional regulator n=1 Tax=Mesorhizobium sp. B2-3-4 TaxID=2589959 RepID=UPI0011263F99|nr:helix-turn-helix transcriptional regulator [Mesorhizobium sp. B2-3-4]TPM24858.1 helix-turn-helix transcriptional regulator [Mesorhizobium sp. B2-3-4]
MIADLPDRIYEAAFVPELWPEVLDQLSRVSNSAAASLILFNGIAPPKFAATDLIRPVLEAFDAANGWQNSDEVQLLFSMTPPSAFVYDADYFPPEALESNHLRLDRTRPLGIGGQVGSFVFMPTGEMALFSTERWQHNDRPSPDEMSRLNALRPHLARAGLVATRLGLERARGTVSAMEKMGLPAAVLSSTGRVVAVNQLLETMPSVFRPAARGDMSIGDREADLLFQQAIHDVPGHAEPPVRSIPVQPREGRPPLIIHLLPLHRAAHDIFSGGHMLMAATALSASSMVPSPALLTGLFDLTPAEARLASALSQGLALKDAAAGLKVTVKTARTYLERIFAKTGTRQQSQLVALLKGADRFPPS